jgi:DNA-binding transcriptional LysR family regulator
MDNLPNINLNRLGIFVMVIEAGSLTAAAARLGLTKTVVSAHIQKLEAEVGASLLVRTTRSLSLTDAGEAFYEASRRITNDVADAVEAAGHATAEPRGRLRITAPVDIGAAIVAPIAVAIQQRYPALAIELLGADRVLDLAAEGIDVAVRVGKLGDSSYQAQRVGSFAEWLVVSPSLLQKMPAQSDPGDLASWPFIALSVLPQPLAWTFERDGHAPRPVRFQPGFVANTALAVHAGVLAGGGLAILPDITVAADVAAGRLLRLFPDWRLPGGGIHVVLPATRHRPKKTRVFVDALRQHFAQTSVSGNAG